MIWPLYLGAGIGILFGLLLIPLCIYCIPYYLWLGIKNDEGKYLEKKDTYIFRQTIDATKVYISWITRKEPKI